MLVYLMNGLSKGPSTLFPECSSLAHRQYVGQRGTMQKKTRPRRNLGTREVFKFNGEEGLAEAVAVVDFRQALQVQLPLPVYRSV
jgi:hypothetical protein